MRHDWIFDVLADLCLYADHNGLPGLKAKVEETLIVARLEVGAAVGDAEGGLPHFRSCRRHGA